MTKNLFTILFLATIVCCSPRLNAKTALDPFGVVQVSNCYQKVVGESGTVKTFKFLNTEGGRHIYPVFTNGLDAKGFNIWNVTTNGAGVEEYHLYTQILDNHSEIDILPGIDKIRVTPVVKDGTFIPTSPVDIEFVDPEFTITDRDLPCLSFNDGAIDFKSNLDGLCDVDFVISCPNAPADLGLPAGFKTPTLKNGNHFNIPINADYCNGDLHPWDAQRCVTFNIAITIKKCNKTPLEDPDYEPCPPVTFNRPLQICCWCGERPLEH